MTANGAPSPVAHWKRRAGGLVATVVQLGALMSLLLIPVVDGHPGFYVAVTWLFDEIGVPVDANIFAALMLFVLGAALRRRKRAAVNTLIAIQGLYALLSGLLLAALVLLGQEALVDPDDPPLPASLAWDLGWHVLVNLCLIGLLLVLRPAFPARLASGSAWRALGSLVGGLLVTWLLGWGLTELFPGNLRDTAARLAWAANQVTGQIVDLPRTGVADGPNWLSVLLGLLGALVGAYALVEFFRAVRSRQLLSADEEIRLRELLAEFGEDDSLGYFATRRDKSVVFDPERRAAVTYRVLGGTSLASGDPIGDREGWSAAIQAWLAEAGRHGWVPAVLGASETGAQWYDKAGLRALEIGDEAVLDVREFSLAGPERRGVRQAVSRVARAGYSTVVRRHRDIPPDEMGEMLRRAEQWRGAQTERGFSMALGRLGDPTDGRCVMVEAYDAEGQLRGLLSFVPWGRAGLSLDLMRRDRDAENGLNEYMVSELVAASGQLGIHRVSLNFAMFRAVFEEGSRIGAGPVLRLWRGILGIASRFFQLESLYRSNAKYGPNWLPRFICYQRSRQLPRISLVAGVAEGFVGTLRRRGGRGVLSTAVVDSEFVARIHQIEESARTAGVHRARLPEQVRVRMAKLERLREEGVEAYPAGFHRDCVLGEIRERFAELPADSFTGHRVTVAGRVIALREVGRLCFAQLRDFTGELQVLLRVDELGPERLASWKSAVDLGDHVGVHGEVMTSRTGELSVQAESWTITAKCLHPLPDKRKGLADPEARVRQRYLDLVVNPDAARMLRVRSDVVRSARDYLHDHGYLEVETPMLQSVHGGATARPFVTHINAYDMRMYLRIAPELYLKRLCVAGVDKVFELNRNFRNEGADATHNPEFTMLEAYQAYADYTTMLHLARGLIQHAAMAAHGEIVAKGIAPDGKPVEHDISGEWPIVRVHEAVSAAFGEEVTADTSAEVLRKQCQRAGVPVREEAGVGDMVLEAYEHLVEPFTTAPTFYTDFPTDVSPLTRQHRVDPRLAERWDLVAFGAEIGTAYSELTDPVEQRRRLEAQSLRAASGDVEAMELDEDFLRALEHGMPPTGGLGMGVDRLLMMLTGASIRQTVLFPFVRPTT
ncbi:bifunctional lysylphosphatidylglycerol synthetase/lysine--tRNA ligase LysX [Kutzneria albida]|uniref:Lysine--tRNA ligase n=1 Tax=Kutzneria albida DSM 43870 TaxID=1449976 RepID=W5W1L7_9PSEU|nr:bifunctional lysylphosphatidylglycerol synthetase/lysine--tRNA ligase LysX [Kutzneria albida]AHH94446.1 Lysylphosphatidylglycerol biosynthesis bifunctional protein LysX [Kutzneria albida DSM 43870]